MRCYYLSDLHLEAQDFSLPLTRGDVLIIAGDLCHASCLDPLRTDPYRLKQRERVLRFVAAARSAFRHVLLVAGNHEYHDGIFEDTVPLLRHHLDGVTVLDDETCTIDGVRFFGTTLWSDFEGRSEASMTRVRRGMGDYVFTKRQTENGLVKLTPADTLAAHDRALAALESELATGTQPVVVVSHHAPSLQGLNPTHRGNGLDGAFASELETFIGALSRVPFWVHGHTHVRKRYTIGNTTTLANCRGFEGKDLSARTFKPTAFFELS